MLSAIPLIPTLTFSLISLIASFFVILRIVLPVLPPHPFSRRVSPTQFGLPNFRTLSEAHKSHLWLAACDLIALAFFLWQVVAENTFQTVVEAAPFNPGSAIRFAVALTLRQSCLVIVITIALTHVRAGKSVSLGAAHSSIWAPTAICIAICTICAGLFANFGLNTLFPGIIAYTGLLTVASTIMFSYLVITLLTIRRSLLQRLEVPTEKGPRPSFATEDIDALKEGSSWLTSTAGSRRDSMSAWSFSTWHSPLPSTQGSVRDPRSASRPSLAPKSSFWFGVNGEEIPPVPPIPSPYRDPSAHTGPRRLPKSSNDSWLSSDDGTQETMTAFSFPTTAPASPENSNVGHDNNDAFVSSRTAVSPLPQSPLPHLSNAKVLGGYGHVGMAEKGFSQSSSASSKGLDISVGKMTMWFAMIWLPFLAALPALIVGCISSATGSFIPAFFLVISVTISSPLLMMTVIFRAPILMPRNLFPSNKHQKMKGFQLRSAAVTADSLDELRGRGVSSSTYTVVEGRRSGDVWMSKGDAVDPKTRLGRALTMLQPSPPLSLLPVDDYYKGDDAEIEPPLALRMDESHPSTPQSAYSAEVGRRKGKTSNASTFYSAMDESLGQSALVMTAQKHVSTMPKTVMMPPSPSKENNQEESAVMPTPKGSVRSTHLRSRSVSSTQTAGREPLTPPPALPLPPTPGQGVARHVTTRHKRSQSSGVASGFSFSPITNHGQIDALSAGMLPLLIPGLSIGPDIEIGAFPYSGKSSRTTPPNISATFSSPDSHSTPVRGKLSARKRRHHFSLPSLSLGKDNAFRLWKTETTRVLEETARSSMLDEPRSDKGRRNTVVGLSALPSTSDLHEEEADELGAVPLFEARPTHHRNASSISVYPEGVESARSSLANLLNMLDVETRRASAESATTLVDDHIPMPTSNSHRHKSASKITDENNTERPQSRKRSSIVYIKSDEPASTHVKRAKILSYQKHAGVRRVVGPGPGDDINTPPKHRPISILQTRDLNIPQDTPPLSVKKMNKAKSPGSALKPLQLARSATTKARGILRKTEVLPRVVVRPPSNTEHELYSVY